MGRDASARRYSLGAKLAIGLGVVSAATVVALLAYLGPLTTAGFVERSKVLIEHSSDGMHEISSQATENSRQILVDLIRNTTETRQRTLTDLPLSLYDGDPERIRAAILRGDAERSTRLQANVAILAREMERRADERIALYAEQLGREQGRMVEAFAGELRTSSLLLAGGVLLASIVLLGLGLWRVVVRPVERLRDATQVVASGDLDVVLASDSKDELGALADDFGRMVDQLRSSREELRRWNEKLEVEVARKTEHLEEALGDLKRAQGELVHAAKMASVGTLAGGVAHEFNNLIGGIRGCAAEALADETDEDRREPLEVIMRAATRGGQITEQLLRFSRHRVGTMERTDVVTAARDALRLVEPHVRRLGVDLVDELPDQLWAHADSTALHQVFVNLSTNALQAMPHGGELRVGGGIEGDLVVVTFADSGEGMPPEVAERVFEPFFTTKDREADPFQRGSGLGLAVSYGIVEAHGGRIDIESEVGRGTTMIVRIPAMKPEIPGASAE